MSDLISRKKLKAIIEPMVGIFEDDGSFWWSRESILRAIDSELVEADEPKVGRWIPYKAYFGQKKDSWVDELKCSECDYGWGDEGYNYCPNCGAKMERSE